MIDIGWIVVALVAVVLAYDIFRRREKGDMVAQRARLIMVEAKVDALHQDALLLTETNQRLEEHIKDFESICTQWRAKVGELEAKCDRVVVNAQNEIAGSLAAVSDITKKGWR